MIGTLHAILKKDATWAASASAARSIGRVATLVLLARSAGVSEIAAFTLLISIETIAISALNALFSSPQSALAPGRRKELRAAIARESERLQCLFGLALGLGGMCIAWSMGAVNDVVLAFCATLISGSAFQAVRSTRITGFRTKPVFATELLVASLGFACPIAAVQIGSDPLEWFWIGIATGQLAGFIWLRQRTRPLASRRSRITVRGALLSTGLKMLAGSIALSLTHRIQPALIGGMLGSPALASFGVANTLASPIRMASGMARGVLLPRLALTHRTVTQARFTRKQRWAASLLCVVATLMLTTGGPLALPVLFGESFRGVGLLGGLLILHACLASMSSVVASLAQAHNRSGACALTRWGSALLGLSAMALVMPSSGLLGLCLVMILNETLTITVLWQVVAHSRRSSVNLNRAHHLGRAKNGRPRRLSWGWRLA